MSYLGFKFYEGKVEIWMCSNCIYPCIFSREPKKGEDHFNCWEGTSFLVGEPGKGETD